MPDGELTRVSAPDGAGWAFAALGVDLLAAHTGAGMRVEPFSRTSLPEWDLLFSAGRVDAVDGPRIERLVGVSGQQGFESKAEHALLVLALAYAAHARQAWPLLRTALGGLQGSARLSLDGRILSYALAETEGGPRRAPRETMASILNDVFARRLAPILRWGAPFLQRMAVDVGWPAPVWIRHLNPGSVWTVVTPEGVEAIRADEDAHEPLARASRLAEGEPLAPNEEGAREAQSRKEIGQEKQRISERLVRLDAERTNLGDQLSVLGIAERVLTRFGGKADTTEKRRRGRPARTAPAAGRSRSALGGQQARRETEPDARSGVGVRGKGRRRSTVSVSEAILRAVQAHGKGATTNEVLSYVLREFGMTVRPNHLGVALQRHRRAGRLENRDQRWYLPPSAQSEQSGQSV